MSNDPPRPEQDPSLNPALKSRTDTTHDTSTSSRSPADSVSVDREEGRAWPMIWLTVTVVCVILAVYFIFG